MKAAERVVVDTNVLVSAILAPRSVPRRWVGWCIANAKIIFTDETEAEFLEVISRSKFDRFASSQSRSTAALVIIEASARVQSDAMVRACRDTRDDKFLDAALAGNVKLLVTGDKDLLVLNPFESIAIVTPAEAIGLRMTSGHA